MERPGKRAKAESRTEELQRYTKAVGAGLRERLMEDVLGMIYATKDGSWKAWQRRRLPGPQPYALSRDKLKVLQEKEYWVAEKSDGVRKMLLVQQGCVFLIDRTWSMEQVDPQIATIVSQSLGGHGPTLIDGELIDSPHDSFPTFLAYDAISVQGSRVGHLPLSKRLAHLNDTVIGAIARAYATLDPKAMRLDIQSKLFLPKAEIQRVVSKIFKKNVADQSEVVYEFIDVKRNRRNKNDGIVFTSEEEPYITSNKMSLLKWKWHDKVTVDFKIKAPYFKSRGNEVALYCSGPEQTDIFLRSITVSPTTQQWIQEMDRKGTSSMVVECHYDKKTGAWVIGHMRPDKKDGNFVTVVFNTLETMVDNVTKEELVMLCTKK